MVTNRRISRAGAVLTIGACLAVAALPASATINANPGFEAGTGGDADNWGEFFFGGGAATIAERTATEPASGSWHMRLHLAGTDPSGSHAEAQNLTPLFSVTPGTLYDFSFDAKRVGDLAPGVVAFYRVQWLDSDGSHGGGVKGSTPLTMFGNSLTETYQPFGFVGLPAAADSDAALIAVWMDGGAQANQFGTVYLDNAALTVPEPASFGLLLAGAALVLRRRQG